ncbi:HlyD family efflux transporter periplasmic adaptor subunit [Bacillus cereus]|nr:HlyD family efflux transporter periplasmic adaptor subunit [Bacillus cereus]
MSKIYTFEELADSVELLEKKQPSFIIKLVLFVFLVMIGGGVWAYLGEIEITTKGTVIVQDISEKSIIRANSVVTVDKVLVRSGDKVRKDDILIKLNEGELIHTLEKLKGEMKYLNEKRDVLLNLKRDILTNQPNDKVATTELDKQIIILEEELSRNEQVLNQSSQEVNNIRAPRAGRVQLHSDLKSGETIESGDKLISIISKDDKRMKILLPPEEVGNLKVGDKIKYDFNIGNNNQKNGTVISVSPLPIFDEVSKNYVYELEGTIDNKTSKLLHVGMKGIATIVTDKEALWEFVLRKLGFINE